MQSSTTVNDSTPAVSPSLGAFARVRADYKEMPGLSLTLPQAARFWGLDQVECRMVLDALVAENFLRFGPRGYTRQ